MSALRSDAERAATLDEHLRHVVGVTGAEYDRGLAVQGPLPMAMFNHYAALIDRSHVLPQLRKWATAQRKSASGRPPVIDFRAVLIIDLLCIMWGHGVHYGEAAKTLMYRLSPAQFELLGIRYEVGSEAKWYHRYWRAKKRMLRLLDPWHATGKRSRLTLQEVARARELEDDTLRDRLRWVAQALVDSSVSLMPAHHRANYPGDVAIDATLVQILGTAGRVLNVDFAAGTYDHSHRDDVARDRPVPGYEANTVVMIDAHGKASGPFPRLVSGLTFHRPTEQTQEARRAMEHHGRSFSERGLVVADRAYNGLRAENFQLPLRKAGWQMVFDYRRIDLGTQASVNNLPVVLVDGQLYVEYLPEKLRMAGYRWANRGMVIDGVLQVNPDTGKAYTVAERDQHLSARQPYALIPKGRPDTDGYQRFTYPDRRGYIAFDPATGKRTKSSLSGSVTIPPQERVVKQVQRYPWKSPMWKSVYGQRNQVESSNKNLKDGRFAELDNPKKRSGRGEAFQFLAVTLYVVATNIRRIVTTLRNEFKASSRPKNRARRRHDEAGLPLAGTAQSGNQALAPPG